MDLFRFSPPTDPEAPEVVRPRHEQSIIRKVSYARQYGNALGAALGHGDVCAIVTAGDTHTIGFQDDAPGSPSWRGFASPEPMCLGTSIQELSSAV